MENKAFVSTDLVGDAEMNKSYIFNETRSTKNYSQPEMMGGNVDFNEITFDQRPGLSSLQPGTFEDLILCSQLQGLSTEANQNPMQNLVKRTTRFFVMEPRDVIVKRIMEHAEHERYGFQLNDYHTITISTLDKRKTPLIFKTNILEMDDKTLVDLRLSKGCGLEFKRHFNKIRLAMDDIIMKEQTAYWLSQQ